MEGLHLYTDYLPKRVNDMKKRLNAIILAKEIEEAELLGVNKITAAIAHNTKNNNILPFLETEIMAFPFESYAIDSLLNKG